MGCEFTQPPTEDPLETALLGWPGAHRAAGRSDQKAASVSGPMWMRVDKDLKAELWGAGRVGTHILVGLGDAAFTLELISATLLCCKPKRPGPHQGPPPPPDFWASICLGEGEFCNSPGWGRRDRGGEEESGSPHPTAESIGPIERDPPHPKEWGLPGMSNKHPALGALARNAVPSGSGQWIPSQGVGSIRAH